MRTVAIIPALDAERTIADVVARTLALVPCVVVVDDGSSDATGAVARAAGAHVLRHEANRGKGAALATGFAHALADGADGVATLDADGQHLPEELPKLLAAADAGADLVLGVRDGLFARMSALRRASNRISSRLISLVAGVPVPDVQTGFRWYRARLVDAVGMRESGFEAESAVVVRAARAGFRVVTVPVELAFADGRSTSHYRALADSLRIARAVWRARFGSAP